MSKVVDVFKEAARPLKSQKELLALTVAEGRGVAINAPQDTTSSRERRADKNDDADFVLEAVQASLTRQREELELAYERFQRRVEMGDDAIAMALLMASTPEERQAIIEYRDERRRRLDEIERKREDGTLRRGHLDEFERWDERRQYETVRRERDRLQTAINDSSPSNPRRTVTFANSVDELDANPGGELSTPFDMAALGDAEPPSTELDADRSPENPLKLTI